MAEILDSEYVKIGTWVFATPACQLEDISGVFAVAEMRGEDRVAAGVAGVAVRPRSRDALIFALPFVIYGDADPDGDPFTDVREGLVTNVNAMRAAILPPSTSPYTRTIIHMRGSTSRTAQCIVTAIDGPEPVGSEALRFAAVVKIPAGVWT